ncbi:hypothetical protein [Ruminococcus sp.]|uniref:hypothetical protein n=1 Tax=Ruminococcus sp. TaxID=41978 RepID=UPI002C5EFB37|nr:hypothetical protein [Ruminococcus sp.]HOA00383.1 hypothetical protein [Ruminococcus sp.]HOH87694.1 hypothetical protein [Ruminococcus sp.]
MRLRPYVHSRDFDAIKEWVADERTNAMWSASHAPYPMEKDAFSDFLTAMYDKHGDCPLCCRNRRRRDSGLYMHFHKHR